ncbi:MAG: PKD domain-containing protein [Candidatus Paceibacterota bacterium]|jgi:hypothetical protein
MRVAGLLALAILTPSLVYAAEPPILATYTISQSVIYPTATAESGLATTTVIDIAFSEPVKASIKILSADGTLMKSLYTSSSVTNPAPKTWDGTNNADTFVVDGTYTVLISATSTATSLSMIDSSGTITVASSGGPDPSEPDPSAPSDATAATGASSSGPAEYLPIPVLRILTSSSRTVSSGADTAFTSAVYDSRGNRRDDAVVTWSFGDGMRRTGANVLHPYHDPGEYIVIVRATTPDGGDAVVETIVTVKDASIKIAAVSSRGITLANDSSRTLDLSWWRLSAGGQEFKIPADTQMLPGRTVLFPSQVIELPVTGSASLLYPSGEVAAAYPAVAAVPQSALKQPSFNGASYEKVQAVEPIISTQTNIRAYEEAVDAPTAATELAAVGAVPAPSIFRSPWFLSFLGVVALAGSAFIFL